jgi:hypothetical protein
MNRLSGQKPLGIMFKSFNRLFRVEIKRVSNTAVILRQIFKKISYHEIEN